MTSPAEQAAAEALAAVANEQYRRAGCAEGGGFAAADFPAEARAVVAAVRPDFLREIADQIEQFPAGIDSREGIVRVLRATADGISRAAARSTTTTEGTDPK